MYLAQDFFYWLQFLLSVYITRSWFPLFITNTVNAVIHTGVILLVDLQFHTWGSVLTSCVQSQLWVLNLGVMLHRCAWLRWLCQGHRYRWSVGSWCDSSDSSPSPAHLPSKPATVCAKQAHPESTQPAESFPCLPILETLYLDKI